VQRAAGPVAAVLGAAVPQVAVEDDDGAGRRDDLDLIGMGGGRVGQCLPGWSPSAASSSASRARIAAVCAADKMPGSGA
jgi:hypothetical protein